MQHGVPDARCFNSFSRVRRFAGRSPDPCVAPSFGNVEACRRFSKETAIGFFYSNEHRPIQVRVRHGGGEAVFDVEQRVELRESQGLKVRELAKAERLQPSIESLSFRMKEETIRIGQIGINFLLEAADTNGSVAMFEFMVPAGAKVPLPHSHKHYDETIYGVKIWKTA